jgi:Tol biopolymer transport system component
LLERCLAKDPDRRWQSAHDLRLELQWIDEHDSLTASPSADSIRPAVKRAGGWVAITALTGMIAVVVGRSFAPPAGDLQPIQFVVTPPQGVAFRPGGGLMNVSPDGRSLVFAARANGQTLLWLRSLDSTTARPLAGTDGGVNPFWSPDSRFVAFFAQGKLKKIEVSGGAPETLCDSGELGGTWSRAGVILFSSDQKDGLFRVGAGGGPATQITWPDATRQEYAHAWPHFLPDGHRYLYRVKSTKTEYTGIYLGTLDGAAAPLRVVAADSNPVYAPGYLLFGREGRVFAQAFDTRRARLVSEPIPIADHVVHNPITGRWTVAASETGVLAYRMRESKQLVWVDRHGRQLDRLGPDGEYTNPVLSPAGDRVAVGRLDPRTDTEDIWVIETVHGTASRLTFDPAWDTEPVWSPDGRQIVFASNRSGHWAIYKKASDGSGAEAQLVSDGLPMDWSRDGQWLLFRNGAPTSASLLTLWILPLERDRRPTPLMRTVPVEAHHGQVSSDGRWLAYASNQSGVSEVFVRPFPSGEGKWQVSQGGGIEPKWRADGSELFYLAPDGRLMSVAIRSTHGFAAGFATPLFDTALSGAFNPVTGTNQYAVAADGQRFLLNRPVSVAASPITVVLNWTSTLRAK